MPRRSSMRRKGRDELEDSASPTKHHPRSSANGLNLERGRGRSRGRGTSPAPRVEEPDVYKSHERNGALQHDIENDAIRNEKAGHVELDHDCAPHVPRTFNYFQAAEKSRKGGAAASKRHAQVSWPSATEIQASLLRQYERGISLDQVPGFKELEALEFERWARLLSHGANLLVYGVGSKQALLQHFAERYSAEAGVSVIFGYHPRASVSDLLVNIQKAIEPSLHVDESAARVEAANDMLDWIAGHPQAHVWVVVHNIDGANLRSQEDQEVLCRLSVLENIHMIASIDHIHAEMMGSSVIHAKFAWIKICVDTCMYYANESSLLPNSFGSFDEKPELQLEGAIITLQSLTVNARKAFALLAAAQAKSAEGGTAAVGSAVGFHELLDNCRMEWILATPADLKLVLNELRDHGLIQIDRTGEQGDRISIPLAQEMLDSILQTIA
ncbi:Origin recognition complex subunit 2 [Porphyridium purpureum]|uniref:Origin recognition complex subunit 2 n=1 Tax=Porphyridium purpureum TaxID=35688 RepID=A0A5J4Z345_PORPP|nr:Origin recognition complex subunit 2 [Porphyridium purpureum]|eukprot:POR0367..scf295_1